MLRNNVRFRSPLFTPPEPDRGQVNPGRYGKELADWLRERLEAFEAVVAEPTHEDWGWVLITYYAGHSFFIGCGNVEASEEEWLVFVEPPPKGLLARFIGGGKAGEAETIALCKAIDIALHSEPEISNVEWFATDDYGQECNRAEHPSSESEAAGHAEFR